MQLRRSDAPLTREIARAQAQMACFRHAVVPVALRVLGRARVSNLVLDRDCGPRRNFEQRACLALIQLAGLGREHCTRGIAVKQSLVVGQGEETHRETHREDEAAGGCGTIGTVATSGCAD